MNNNTARTENKVYKPPPITAYSVSDRQNLDCNLTREEAAGHKLKTITNTVTYET